MARLARRSLRIKDLPIFSLSQSFRDLADTELPELPLNFFEPRYVELARRIAPPKGDGKFGYTQVVQRRKGGRGMLVAARDFRWSGSDGPVVFFARGLRRFRILSVRSESMKQGDPLYKAHVQLLSDRDLSRMQVSQDSTGPGTIFGQVYVQDGGGLGFASYHFHQEGSFISYESAMSKSFSPLDDGSQPPQRKEFLDASFDQEKRIFRGTIDWSPSSWQGDQRWVYQMYFSTDFEQIVGGIVEAIPADPAGRSKIIRFGVNLHYSRLQLGLDADSVKDVLLQSGVPASNAEAALGEAVVATAEPLAATTLAEAEETLQLAEPVRGHMCQRRTVQRSLKSIISSSRPYWARLAAVTRLGRLATPPVPVMEAENALHAALLAVAENGEGELQGAIEDALRSCWEDSGDAKVNAEMAEGVQLLDDQKVDEALQIFTGVLEKAPGFAEAWHKRSIAYFAQKNFKEAVEDCRKALEIRPLHYWCLTGMGTCHYELGEKEKAMECWKAALQVCPLMPGAQTKLDEAEVNEIIDQHLRPRMDRLINAFGDGEPQLELAGSSHWDVHRIRMDQEKFPGVWAYFFRLSLRRPAGCSTLKSRARFYVLKGSDGKVFPFTRPTIGSASFSLKPGEEYKFCWCLVVGRELQRIVAGQLMETEDTAGASGAAGEFHHEELPMLFPTGAPEIELSDAERLGPGDGYTFTGHLDLWTMAGF
ncbi:unnamed protein product [Cladocopium goreaui]|uniref:Uncharacterized protein n=1 Tax=Cladocopium goreaui TaxID=2562237 RepID=A0A9P1BGV0_9DINO|nr:unnamed protein product [Cladocopium goreaui]